MGLLGLPAQNFYTINIVSGYYWQGIPVLFILGAFLLIFSFYALNWPVPGDSPARRTDRLLLVFALAWLILASSLTINNYQDRGALANNSAPAGQAGAVQTMAVTVPNAAPNHSESAVINGVVLFSSQPLSPAAAPRLALYFILIFIIGGGLVWLLRPARSKLAWINWILAYGLGSSGLAIILFFYFFIGRQPAAPVLDYLVWGLAVATIIAVIGRRVYPRRAEWSAFAARLKPARLATAVRSGWSALSPGRRGLVFLISGFFLINLFGLFQIAATRLSGNYDSVVMWSLKAKLLNYERQINFDPQATFYLGGGAHLNYPWQIPLLQYWLNANLGAYNDLAGNWIFVGYFLSWVGLIFYFLHKRLGPLRAGLWSFFLFTMPLVFYHGSNAYADLPLAFYVTAAVAFFGVWLAERRRDDLILAAVFWGLSGWVKNDALLFFLPFFLIFFFYAIKKICSFSDLLKFLLTALVVYSPWWIFRQVYHLGLANAPAGFFFSPGAIISLLESLFVSYSWNLWWFIAIIAGFYYFWSRPRSSAVSFFWSFLFLSFLSLILVYVFSADYAYALDQTAVSRTLFGLLGPSVLAVGFSLARPKTSQKINP